MSFKGKVVIVTGASSGIGAATAIAFTADGATVVMVGRNTTKLNKVAAICEQKGAKPLVVVADVSINKDCDKILDETLKAFGKLDILVNNAGIYIPAGILDSNAMDSYNSVMSTNLTSVVYLTHIAAPHLIKTKGNIVNISSIASTLVLQNTFAYMVSKIGMDHFTRAAALELAPKGVRVNVVNPGLVKTDIIEKTGVPAEHLDETMERLGKQAPLGKYGESEEIADLILFLASDKARSITGSSYVSDNGGLLVGPLDPSSFANQ